MAEGKNPMPESWVGMNCCWLQLMGLKQMSAEEEKNPEGRNEGDWEAHWESHPVTLWPNWMMGMGHGYKVRVLMEAEATRSPLACRNICWGGTLNHSN